MNIGDVISDFDLLIIGAGPAGLAASQKAISLNKRVLVVDWGIHTHPHYSARSESDVEYEVGGIGGTAGHWGGQFGFLSQEDKYNWTTISKYDDKFFSQLDNECLKWARKMRTKNVERIELDHELEFANQSYFRETFTIRPELSNITSIFQSTIESKNFKYIGNKKLKYIEKTISGTRKMVFENETIDLPDIPILLAMGCMETTNVIHRSLARSGERIPTKLGHNLADHPWIYGKKYVPSLIFGKQPPELFYEGRKRKFKTSVYRETEKLFHSGIFEIRTTVDNIFLNPFYKDFYRVKNICSLILRLIMLKKYSQILRSEYQIWIQLEQFRNHESFIEIGAESSISHWKMSSNDILLFNQVSENAEQTLSRYRVKESGGNSNDTQLVFNQAYHPSGTLQAGPEDGDSVADQYGKIYGLEQTWIASSAIFPTSGWMNPSLLIMAYSGLIVEQIFDLEGS